MFHVKQLIKYLDALEKAFKFPAIAPVRWERISRLRDFIVKWVEGRIYGRWPKTSLPAWRRSNPPESIQAPKCWCGHYARSHTKGECQVFDCPCDAFMDSSAVVCTHCLQVHASEHPCMAPGVVTYVDNNWTPKVVGGISRGVLVNFKPAKGKHEEF